MLKTTTEFPMPGSYALLDGVQVRIISHRPGDTALVSLSRVGESVTRTVPLATLQHPAPERAIFRRKRRGRKAAV